MTPANDRLSRRTLLGAGALAVAMSAIDARSESLYPAKPIRMIIPFSAGSGTEVAARYFGQQIGKLTGQSVVVDPRGGGNGIIGVKAVLDSPRDGYTLLYGTTSTLATNVALIKNLPYDPLRDFMPVSLTMRSPILVLVPATSSAKSLKELVEVAGRPRAELRVGVGSVNYRLVAELLAEKLGVALEPIPYKSAPDSIRDVASGEVPAAVADVMSALPMVESGRARALMVISGARLPILPKVPTAAEAGFEGFTHSPWNGVAAPVGTPPDIAARLSQLFGRVLAMPETTDFFARQGAETLPAGQEVMTNFIREEIERWRRVAEAAKIQLN